jgi:hypothetical protein
MTALRLSALLVVFTGSTCSSLGGGFSVSIMKEEDGRWIRTRTKRMVTI